MADFDDRDFDEGSSARADRAGGADVGAPSIRGGLLDQATFPTSLGRQADALSLERPDPEIAGPLDADVHAEVLNDIDKAQAALPRLRTPTALGAGMRHIDPYPGMNRTPPGGYPAPSAQALRDFLNGSPLPKDVFGPHITFNNDAPGRPSTDLPVTNALANMVEQAVVDSGFHSVNINSSVRPSDGSSSNHPRRRAVDINAINGLKVVDRPDLGVALQEVFARQPAIRENFGPGYQVKTKSPGSAPTPVAKVAEGHRNHDHFSSQR